MSTKHDGLLKKNAMQKDHKENMNLLFYDFNHAAGGQQEPLSSIIEEGAECFPDPQAVAHFQNVVSSTGTNFFSKIGDRLPTRDAKSRRGMKLASGQSQRGHSLVDSTGSKNQIIDRFNNSNVPHQSTSVVHQ